MSSANLAEKSLTGRYRNQRFVCGVVLTLIFLSGAVVGALAMDFGVHNRPRPPAFETAQGKALYFERLKKDLDLTPAQAEQVESVLNDLWQYYRSVLSDSKQRVEQILNDQQRVKFEKWLQQQAPR